MTVDLNALIADAGKVKSYCFMKSEVPLVEAVKTVLASPSGRDFHSLDSYVPRLGSAVPRPLRFHIGLCRAI